MKIYEVNWRSFDNQSLREWASSKAKANQIISNIKLEDPDSANHVVFERNMGKTKKQILNWMNIYCPRD